MDYVFDFDVVDVAQEDAQVSTESIDNDEGYEFPLFSAATAGSSLKCVSLKEEVDEHVFATRPDSYFFAESSEELNREYQQAAVSYDDLFRKLQFPCSTGRKATDLKDLNRQNAGKRHKNRLGLTLRRLRNERRASLAKRQKPQRLNAMNARKVHIVFKHRRRARASK